MSSSVNPKQIDIPSWVIFTDWSPPKKGHDSILNWDVIDELVPHHEKIIKNKYKIL